jgi:hypothetical protein
MEDLSNIGYNTYYLGVPKNIQECLGIYLYKQSGTDREIITLYNISEILEQIKSGAWDEGLSRPATLMSTRKSTSDYFIIEPAGQEDIIEFDTVIYLDTTGLSAVGYTSFATTQSTRITDTDTVGSLRVQLNFTVGPDNVATVSLINSLSEVSSVSGDSELSKESLGTEQSEYTDASEVLGWEGDNYLRYTGLARNLKSGMILGTDTASFYGPLQGWSFGLAPEVVLNDYDTSFTNFSVGYLGGEVVLYEWDSSFSYRVLSLMDVNKFSVPAERYSGQITGVSAGDTLEYMASEYAVFSKSAGGNYLYRISDGEWIKPETTMSLYIDPWDVTGKVVWYDPSQEWSDIEEIHNDVLYRDILGTSYKPTQATGVLKLSRKIGPWMIWKNVDYLGKTWYIYSNPSGYAIFGESENIIPVNHKCLLGQSVALERTATVGVTYTFYFTDSGKETKSSSGDTDPDLTYTISSVSALGDPVIDGLRHRPYSGTYLPGTEPDSGSCIITAYRGVLFYLDYTDTEAGTKLKYL